MNQKRSSEKPESLLIGRDETLDGDSQEALELSETVQSREGQARPKVTSSEFPVTAWDRYEFERLLGKGGMGAVYQARDRKLGRTVALKFIRGDDAGLSARFMQEARAQSRLSHHNICQVYETGEVEGKWYIAMEYIDGVPLDKAAKALRLDDKVQVIRDVARALHSAHDLGIIHRDIKPSNVMTVEKLGKTACSRVRGGGKCSRLAVCY
jgi:serine/threonine protein kinase